jgi:spore coat protein H
MRKLFKLTVVLLVLTLVVSAFILNPVWIQAQNASQAAFAISNITPALNESVTFDATSSTVWPEDTSFNWDFSDGTTASGIQVTHAFTTVDDFKVRLTVTDSNNQTHTISEWIFVGRPQGWAENTHQSENGDYEVVFPEDKVLRMDITISAENFKTMEDDLANLTAIDGSDSVYVPVTIKFNNCTWWNVGMRYKANNTLSLVKQAGKHKYPFMLDFNKFEADCPEIKGQKFYGFKQLSCNNNWLDASYVLDVTCSDIFRAGGVPTARGSFCRMYINTGDGPVYWGLYSVFEQPEDQMIKTQFPDANGNMYRPEGKGANWVTWNQDAFEKKTNQDAADWSDVKAAVTALNADRSDVAAWRAGLEAVFDVKTFLSWLAINTAIVNTDNFDTSAQSYYLYQNMANEGRLVWIPWDFNMFLTTASGSSMGDGGMPSAMPSDTAVPTDGAIKAAMPDRDDLPVRADGEGSSLALSEVDNNWPLIRFLIDDPVYHKIYKTELQKTLFGCFNEVRVTAEIRRMHEMVRPYVVGPEGENATYSSLSNGQTEFDQALTDLITHISNRQTAIKDLLGLGTPALATTAATPRHNSWTQNLNQVIAKPSLSKPKNNTDFLKRSVVKPKKNLIAKRGDMNVNVKKIVLIILTTVLLMGMIAFGAMACCRGNDRDKIQNKKRMETPGRHRPQMGNWDPQENRSVKGEDQRPAPESAPVVKKPAPVQGCNPNCQALPYEQLWR